jgi:hypothetical protein
MSRPIVQLVSNHLSLQIHNSAQQTSTHEVVDILLANLASFLHTAHVPENASEEVKDVEKDRILRVQSILGAVWFTAAIKKESFRADSNHIEFVLPDRAGSITILFREKTSTDKVGVVYS